MTKRLWSIFSILLIAALVLVACQRQPEAPPPAATEPPPPAAATDVPAAPEPTQPPAAEPPPTTEEKVISIWHQWEGGYLETIMQVFRDYEAQNPGIRIDVEKPDEVPDALRVAIPAGEGPDIIGWAVDQIGNQALVGNIVPLEDYGVDMAFLQNNFEPAAVQGVVWMDQIWAVPESQEGIAIVYNRAVASEADFPSDPMDFEDLLAKSQAFADANPGKYLVCNQALGGNDAYHVAPIYFGHGIPSYVDDEGNAYLDTPEALAAGEWLAEFRQYHPTEASHEICRTMLVEGQVASWWTGPWAIADLEGAGVDYGILPMGSPFVGIKSFMVTKNAVDRGNAEIAVDIIKFFTNAENSKNLSLANKTIPASTAALQDPEIQALDTIAGFGASLNLGVPMANTPFAGAQWGPVGDATLAIWTGAQTPEEALSAAQQTIENAIADMQ
jgi:arabinogalactan oligomer / maltooligosaccharide transport system substrate-binding protein